MDAYQTAPKTGSRKSGVGLFIVEALGRTKRIWHGWHGEHVVDNATELVVTFHINMSQGSNNRDTKRTKET